MGDAEIGDVVGVGAITASPESLKLREEASEAPLAEEPSRSSEKDESEPNCALDGFVTVSVSKTRASVGWK